MTTKSQAVAADIKALLRARNPLLWIVTREEARVESYLVEAAAAANYVPYTWDCGQGVADMTGAVNNDLGGTDPGGVMTVIRDMAGRGNGQRSVWIMRDLTPWLSGPIGMTTLRTLRNLARSLPGTPRENAQAIIVLTPSAEIPPELADHAMVIDWPLPDREEIAAILDIVIEPLPDEIKEKALTADIREAAIDAAVGLSGEEAKACYAKSLVQLRRIDPTTVAKEKRRVIARERVLEWYDPIPGGLDAVGGFDVLKTWLGQRQKAYSAEAREYALPAPRGIVVVGVSGTGKSLVAKAVGTAWGIPTLKLDLGSLKAKFVGESEANLRKAQRTIDAVGRCVVWIDEIEKAIVTEGAADGGVSSDQLGSLLSWMQERTGEAFIIATANDVSKLPPELLRSGRFDAIWWVDLPTRNERVEILGAALRQYGRGRLVEGSPATRLIAAGDVADATDGFTGAEIASLVPDAMFTAFADDSREIETGDLLEAARNVVPISKTAADKIKALRDWAVGKARPVTGGEKAQLTPSSRRTVLDL